MFWRISPVECDHGFGQSWTDVCFIVFTDRVWTKAELGCAAAHCWQFCYSSAVVERKIYCDLTLQYGRSSDGIEEWLYWDMKKYLEKIFRHTVHEKYFKRMKITDIDIKFQNMSTFLAVWRQQIPVKLMIIILVVKKSSLSHVVKKLLSIQCYISMKSVSSD